MKNASLFRSNRPAFRHALLTLLLMAGCMTMMAQPGITLFEDKFEGGFLSAWTPVPNLSGTNGVVEVVDNGGTDGSKGVRMGRISGDGQFTRNGLNLKLPNLPNTDHIKLTFSIYSNKEESQPEDGLYLSTNNGVTFTQIWKFNAGDWCHNQYGQYPPFDLSQLAAANGLTLNNQSVLRFVQNDDQDFSNSGTGTDGLFIDDVRVYRQVPAYFQVQPTVDFFDDFEAPHLSDHWAWRFADATVELSQLPTQPSNVVEIGTGDGLNNSRGVYMGKRFCDGTFLGNALDAHVNFSQLSADEKSRVELSFWINGNDDETQNDDGIYFSNDAGATWVKIFDFTPGTWCNDQYGQFPPLQLEALVNKQNKTLNGNCIIRFQQFDDEDFNNGGTGRDGLLLDEVRVYVAPRKFASVEFQEDFETGGLRDMESWSFFDDPALPSPNITSPSNFVGVVSGEGENSQYGLVMGKRYCDGNFLTNAFHIYLNLNGATGVQLAYSIYSYNEETQAQDGIYFSDNGGLTFKKVANFTNLVSSQWRQNTLNVDALANSNALEFTPNFVIRFVQHDDEDFSNGGSGADGIVLDNINIIATTPTTAIRQPQMAEHLVRIFPNPSSQGRVNADLPDVFQGKTLTCRLYDSQGRFLHQQCIEAAPEQIGVDCSSAQAGMLLLEIQSETQVWRGRFVKH